MTNPHAKSLIKSLLSHATLSCKKTQDMKLSEIQAAMAVFFEQEDIDEAMSELVELSEPAPRTPTHDRDKVTFYYYHQRLDVEPIPFAPNEKALREVIKACYREVANPDEELLSWIDDNTFNYNKVPYSVTALWSVDVPGNGHAGYVDAIPMDAAVNDE